MKESLKLGAILLIIAAVSGTILAGVNYFTAPVIAQKELEATLESYQAIYGEKADEFEEYDPSKTAAIQEKHPEIAKIFVAKKGGEKVGYGINFFCNGFGGKMQNAVGFMTDDTMAGFRNIQNSETPGFGSRIGEEEYFSTFVDKSIAGPLKGTGDGSGEDAVMSISGATVSSKAVLGALNEVIEIYHSEIAE
ncbi:MAG: FMN-binding protein [Tissierellia bacterium]|nr:FMN-binding protein [Tissierellia bacterium]